MKQSPASIIHGGQLRQISERFSIPVAQLLDFSASINPLGPPASVLAAIRLALESPEVLGRYPDLEELELKRCIAAAARLDVNTIAVANGLSHFSKPPCAASLCVAASCPFRASGSTGASSRLQTSPSQRIHSTLKTAFATIRTS